MILLMWSSWRQFLSLSTRFVNSRGILTGHPHWFLIWDATRVKRTFNNLHWVSYFQEVWSTEFTPRENWLVKKKYFSWTVMRPYLPIIFVCQLMFVKRRHRNSLHEKHYYVFFARYASDIGYQPGGGIMVS